MNLTFKRATRANVPLKVGISGPSGSGKTTAALRLARGLIGPGGKLAFLDTENGSGSLYADMTEFDALDMNPPYQVAKFLAAIDSAVQGGYQALVIDSASHEWIQILQDKEALDARGGNQWTNWATFTKQHELFLAAIRNCPIHVICCLRGKEKHEMAGDSKKVVKLGVGSQMRDGFEFELTVSFDLDMKHNAVTSKDRTRLFDGRLEPVTESTGRELALWLASGGVLAPEQERPTSAQTGGTAPSAADQTNGAQATTDRAPNLTEKETQQILGEMVQEKAAEAKAKEVTGPAADFADAVADGPTICSPEECTEITDAAVRGKVPLEKLAAYLHKKGYMPNPKDWTRITKDGHKTVLPHLTDDGKRRALIAFLNNPANLAA